MLLESAWNLLATLDPASDYYAAVDGAASWLETVISRASPGQSEVASAMAALTQVMAGIY